MATKSKEKEMSLDVDEILNRVKIAGDSVDEIMKIREEFGKLKDKSLEDTEGYDSTALIDKAGKMSQELDKHFLLRRYREMIALTRTAFIAQHIVIERLASKCEKIVEQIEKIKEMVESA